MARYDYEGLYTATGRFLKRELKKRGITQSVLAEEFGIDDRTVRRWVNGEVHSLDVVVDIAMYFEVSVGDVLSDEDGVPFLVL